MLLGLLAATAIALVVVYVRLSSGPFSLHFLVAPIERVLAEEFPGVTAEVNDAVLSLNSSGALEMRLSDVALVDNNGRFRTEASHATFELSFRALLSGRIAPARIDLLRPRVLIRSGPESQAMAYGRVLQGRTIKMPAVAESDREVQIPKSGAGPVPRTETVIRRRFEIARTLAEVARQVRRRKGTASYLQTLSLREAALTLEDGGQISTIEVPELTLAFDRSDPDGIIKGSALISGDGAPVRVRFDASDRSGPSLLDVKIEFERFVPRRLAMNQPALGLLEGLDLPVSATLVLQLTRLGELVSAEMQASLGGGVVYLPWLAKVPLQLNGGEVRGTYLEETQSFRLDEIALRSGDSRVRLVGTVEPALAPEGGTGWRIALAGLDGSIGSDQPGLKPLPIERLTFEGHLYPESRHAEVRAFRLRVAGAEVAFDGEISAEESTRTGRLNGTIGAMPIAVLHRLWPRALAPQTREWTMKHGVSGKLVKGSLTVVSKGAAKPAGSVGQAPVRQVMLNAEFESLSMVLDPAGQRLHAGRALLEVDGSEARLTFPQAILGSDPNQVQLRQAVLNFTAIDGPSPKARIETRMAGSLVAAIAAMQNGPMAQLASYGLDPASLDGRIEGVIVAEWPVGPRVAADKLQLLDGTRLRATEGHATLTAARKSISGASLMVEVRGGHLEGSGEMLISGIHTRVGWRQAMGAGPARTQLRLRTLLGNSERAQLGIELAPIITGDIGLDVLLASEPGEPPRMHVTADLTKAEMQIRDIAWTKPVGERTEARFDVGRRPDGQVVLQNLKLTSENNSIAAAGWIALGQDSKPVEYMFQQITFNTASAFQVEGRRRADDTWLVKARGSFFDAGRLIDQWLALKEHAGPEMTGSMELHATVDTVRGKAYDANVGGRSEDIVHPRLMGVTLAMEKTRGVLTRLQFSSQHTSGRPLTATLPGDRAAPRRLDIDIADAGEALKFLGLYTRMVGGHGRLAIQLDARGPTERTGELEIVKFQVLGDSTLGEIVHTPDPSQPHIGQSAISGRRAPPERLYFDRLEARFRSGNGQLVIDRASVSGPLFGASIRGKLDFRIREMNLGGTYVPLTDLNRAFADLPFLGELLTGPRREGVIGMTFQISGRFENPRVVPIPFSLATPGILREIFQITPEAPAGSPERQGSRPKRGPTPRITASPPATGPSASDGAAAASARTSSEPPAASSPVLEGWGARSNPPRAGGAAPSRP